MAPGGVGCLKWRRGGFGIHQRWGEEDDGVPTLSQSFITDGRCYHPDLV